MSSITLAQLSINLSSADGFVRHDTAKAIELAVFERAVEKNDLSIYLKNEINNKNSESKRRGEAILLAGRLNLNDLIPDLLELLIDETTDEVDSKLRSKARWALARMGEHSVTYLSEIFLTNGLAEESKHFVILTAADIGSLASFAVLERAVRDKSANVRYYGFNAMEIVLKRASKEGALELRAKAASSIDSIFSEEVPWVLSSASEVLKEMPFIESETLFRHLLNRPEDAVRLTAAEALNSVKVGASLEFVEEFLQHEKIQSVHERLERARILILMRRDKSH